MIKVDEFDIEYTKAFHDYEGGVIGIPDDLAVSISDVFMNLDAYWPDYDPNDPEDVEYLESHKHFTITKQQLDERCKASYESMLAMLKKYADYS